MFARTDRLTLRPAWPEDAAELAAAIGHDTVTSMLSRVPAPYTLADAEDFCARGHAPDEARFLILSHDLTWPDGTPAIVGGIALAISLLLACAWSTSAASLWKRGDSLLSAQRSSG